MWNPADVGVAPILDIKKTIKKIPSGSIVRLGGMTDCFQPIEEQVENTYKTIKLLNQKKIHYLIVTKSPLIAEDKYLNVLNPEYAHIQVSIATNDDNVLNRTDNAVSFDERKRTIETLYDCGFDVCLRLAPFFYETCDFDIINNINVDKCLVEFLRTKPSLEKVLKGIVTFSDYSVKEGGYRHLPLDKKLNVLSMLDFPELSVCDDVNEHYNYFKENVNFNRDDCCNLTLQ